MFRKLEKIYTPAAHQGFLGNGHMARQVIGNDFYNTDPFIILMDDVLDKKDSLPVGGPHPHAGFETVSLMLEGEIGEPPHELRKGGLQVMTAGSGIVHTETIEKPQRMRLLQLWLVLPKSQRWAQPRLQDLKAEDVPSIEEQGVKVYVYSGHFAGLSSPVLMHTPFILAELKLLAGATTLQTIPSHWTTFLYNIDGSVIIGENGKELKKNQVGLMSRSMETGDSELLLQGGQEGGHVVIYAGEPQNAPIISHGPFIGDTQEDIYRLYKEFREGKMKHVSTLPDEQVFIWKHPLNRQIGNT